MLKRLHDIKGSDAAASEMQFARPFANIGKDLMKSKSPQILTSNSEVQSIMNGDSHSNDGEDGGDHDEVRRLGVGALGGGGTVSFCRTIFSLPLGIFVYPFKIYLFTFEA